MKMPVELQDLHIRPIPNGNYPRTTPRFEINLAVTVQILIPEDTFVPSVVAGEAIDVSLKGLKVHLNELPRELYHKLLLQPRLVRVCLTDPFKHEPIKITGRIIWIDYHRGEDKESERIGHCYMGICFEDQKGENLSGYRAFISEIETIMAGKSSTAVRV